MSQIISGTVTVTKGSTTVNGAGTSWLGKVKAGNYFIIQTSSGIVGAGVSYEVAADATSNASLELSESWKGQSASGVAYAIHIDFQPNGFPLMLPGDLEIMPIFNLTVKKLRNLYGTIGDITLQGTVGMYPTLADGESGTANGDYFWVASGSPAELTLYRNVGGNGDLIGTWPLLEDIEAQLQDALTTLQQQQDAFQAAHVRLSRSLSVMPDMGETLRSDSIRDGHGLGAVLLGGMTQALPFNELWTVTRNGPKSYIDATGMWAIAATNELPVSYDPVTLRPVARVVEEQRTNVVKWSQTLTSSYWNKAGLSNITSQSFDTSAGVQAVLSSGLETRIAGSVWTGQWLISKATPLGLVVFTIDEGIGTNRGRVTMDFPAGELGSPSSQGDFNNTSARLIDCGDKWQIVVTTTTGAGTNVRLRLFSDTASTGTGTTELEFQQLEQGATPTSYIPTEGAAVTRLGDDVRREEMGFLFQRKITIVGEQISRNLLSSGYITCFKLGSVPDVFGAGFASQVRVNDFRVLVGQGTTGTTRLYFSYPISVSANDQIIKYAVSLDLDLEEVGVSVNGGNAQYYDATGVDVPDLQRFWISLFSSVGGVSESFGQKPLREIRALNYIPTAAELKELATP